MIETFEKYNKILELALDEVGNGLGHLYRHEQFILGGIFPPVYEGHYLTKDEQKKFLGIFPYLSIEKIAKITSEPKSTKGLFSRHKTKADGLEIKVLTTDSVLRELINSFATKMEKLLNEPAKVY